MPAHYTARMQASRAGQFRRWVGLTSGLWLGLGVSATASALPRVCGNQPALGNWVEGACPELQDQGNGVFSATVTLTQTPLLAYKILPLGTWASGIELRAQGTCPADGGMEQNTTQNVQVIAPPVQQPVTFYYDSRMLADTSFSPAPANRSAGDSVRMLSPAGTCPRFVAVGDFQDVAGDNASAVELSLREPGVYVGRTVATRPLGAGWRWKVIEHGVSVPREIGPSGPAYSPCRAEYATVAMPVLVDQNVYFVLHAQVGRFQTLVSSTNLDGFSPDGSQACATPPDLAGPLDAAPPSADLGAPADAGLRNRPGIHCDCHLAAASADPPGAQGTTMMVGSAILLGILRAQKRRKSVAHAARP